MLGTTNRSSLTYLVTRHSGAKAWVQARGIFFDHHQPHLNVDNIESGDTVIGTLPIHMVADICERGGRYFHLTLHVPHDVRGHELSQEQLDQYGATLEAFQVGRSEETPPGAG